MDSIRQALSIFNKFGFQTQPVGIKYLFQKPDNIAKLEKNMALCEMIKEAQQRDSAFYAVPENQVCKAGGYVWGSESPKVFESGNFGVALQLFKDARADVRLHKQAPTLDKETIKHIAFSQLNRLSFDPDVLIVLTDSVSQSEIILRAMTYTTGEVWTSKMTSVMGCSWLMVHPYISGEVNYITTGFGSGMKAKKLFPEGRQLIAIPYNWLPVITQNLGEMPWIPPAWASDDLNAFIKQIYIDLGVSPQSR